MLLFYKPLHRLLKIITYIISQELNISPDACSGVPNVSNPASSEKAAVTSGDDLEFQLHSLCSPSHVLRLLLYTWPARSDGKLRSRPFYLPTELR